MWDQLERRVAATPDALFLVDDNGRHLTFSEFRRAAHETAAGLTAHGIGPGTVVAWALPTRIDTCVLMAAYQSVDPSIMSDGTDTGARLSLPELHQMVARAFSV
jgi:acyl-CoA synthetase (AMP-forming)/AMP-acid ligase II